MRGARTALGAFALLLSLAAAARAEEIVVSNYAIAANGMPYAVAIEKGFFKQAGADVTGILSSEGGGTTVRNLLGGGLAFGEVDIGGTVTAIGQGADLKIISDDVLTVGEFVWATKPGAPVHTVQDFKGHKLGYTNPRSTSQALDVLLLQTAGLSPAEVPMIKVGGFGEQVVALTLGAIDIATLADPVWSKNSSRLATVVKAADVLPPLCNVVGVATGRAIATRGDFLRAVLRGRRLAVKFIYAHPDEAGDIVAKVYKLDPAVARQAIANLVAPSAKTKIPYWGLGRFDVAGMSRMIAAQKVVGGVDADPDWSKLIDREFLPDDQKADY